MTTLFISHSSKDLAWAERTRAALARGGYQCLFLDSHPDDGIHVGADWEQTLYQRLRQSRGVVILCSANWLASPWCVAEAMMSRDRGKRVFLIAAAEVSDGRQVKLPDGTDAPRMPDFLKDTQFASLRGVTEDEAHRRLRARLAAYHAGEISYGELDASIQGWINHVRYADSWGLRRHVLETLPARPAEHRRAIAERQQRPG